MPPCDGHLCRFRAASQFPQRVGESALRLAASTISGAWRSPSPSGPKPKPLDPRAGGPRPSNGRALGSS